MAVYTVSQDQAGKSLKQLQANTGYAFRSDVLGDRLGINENTPLTAGQTFNMDWTDPGSGEYQFLQKYFSPQSYQDYASKQALAQQQAAIAPAVSSLQASIPEVKSLYEQQGQFLQQQQDPLKARYDAIIQGLTGAENKQVGTEQTAASQEWGKRGLSSQSGAYNQYLANRVNPITDYYENQKATTGVAEQGDLLKIAQAIAQVPTQETGALRDVYNAIASLQANAGQSAITNALDMTKFQTNIEQQNKELEQAMKIADMQNQAKTQLIQDNSGNWYAFNPSTNSTSALIGA